MPERPEAKDPGALWKTQPEERLTVDLQQILKTRTGELAFRTRSEILTSIGAAVLFVVVLVWRLGPAREILQQAGYAAALVWAAFSLYWFRSLIWPAPVPPGAAAATGLDYYRRQLEQRRDHLRRAWLWHGPLFFACVVLGAILASGTYSGYQPLWKVLPLVVLLAAWTGFGLWRRRAQAKEVQREIDEL